MWKKARPDPATSAWDIWTYDLLRPVPVKTRLTFDPADDTRAISSPDSRSIVFESNREGHWDLYHKLASGVGNDVCLLQNSEDKFARSWSSDGKFLLRDEWDPQPRADVWILLMTGGQKAYPLVETPFIEYDGQFSPISPLKA